MKQIDETTSHFSLTMAASLTSAVELVCGTSRQCLPKGAKYVACDASATTARMKWIDRDWPPEELPEECIHCSRKFADISSPKLVPIAMERDLHSEKFHIIGTFCGPRCALGYLYERYQGLDAQRPWTLTITMLNTCFGVPEHDLVPALPRLMLKKYGGLYDIENSAEDREIFFGQGHSELNGYKIYKSPFVSLPMIMELHAKIEHEVVSTEPVGAVAAAAPPTSSSVTLGPLEDHWLPKSEMFDFIRARLPSTPSSSSSMASPVLLAGSSSSTAASSAAAAAARKRKTMSVVKTTTSATSATTAASKGTLMSFSGLTAEDD